MYLVEARRARVWLELSWVSFSKIEEIAEVGH